MFDAIILQRLNNHNGDSIWRDVIYHLNVDQERTHMIDTLGAKGFALNDGLVFVNKPAIGRYRTQGRTLGDCLA